MQSFGKTDVALTPNALFAEMNRRMDGLEAIMEQNEPCAASCQALAEEWKRLYALALEGFRQGYLKLRNKIKAQLPMPQICKACKRAERAAIDAAIVRNVSFRLIASRYGMSDASVRRHKTHVAVSIAKANELREEHFGANIRDQFRRINHEAWEHHAEMKAQGDHRGAIVALREIREGVATEEELLSHALKVQAVTDPPSMVIEVRDLSEPALPRLPAPLPARTLQ
jgi:hypothetical protein